MSRAQDIPASTVFPSGSRSMESSPEYTLVAQTDAFSGLRPITPAQSVRYSKPGGISATYQTIPPALFSRQGEPEPGYLPLDWSDHIQAEGQKYFCHGKARFITEANIYDPEKLKRICHWMAVTIKFAEARNINITASNEILLQLDEGDEDTCGYYVADHDSATVFWFQEVSSEELDIPASASLSQLRWTFNELYWTHVEYFPAHLQGLQMSCARELLSILTHARADHLTSLVGTFPYSADQCKDFAELLRDHISESAEVISDRYVICVIARLWGQVARHRFLNLYGEENARLSRDQRVTNAAPKELPFLLRSFSNIALLNIPQKYCNELNGLWVDNIVYAEPWKSFVDRCIRDWQETAVWTAGLTSMHAIIYFGSLGSSTISISALALSICCFISNMVLANYHKMSLNFQTMEAASYLDRMNHSVYGFAPLSWVYGIPKALLFWSAGLMALQGAFVTFQALPFHNPVVAGSLACLIILVIFSVGYVLRLQNVLSRCIPFIRSETHRDDDLERNDETVEDKF